MPEKTKLIDITYDDLISKIPLYKELCVQWKNSDFKEETIYPKEDYQDNTYRTNYPKEFQNLIDFLKFSEFISCNCPTCKKNVSLKVNSSEFSDQKLLDNCILSYCDSDIDNEEYSIPNCDEVMKSRVNALTRFGYYDKYLGCPICNQMYKVSFKIMQADDVSKDIYGVKLIKIGQYPPVVQFNYPNESSYRKLLIKMDAWDDYKNAQKTHSDGYNVGAFAYLRRIIEKLIIYIYKINESNPEDLGAFCKKSFDIKIENVKCYLPASLDNQFYGLISAGMHMLSEEDCKEYYQTVDSSIMCILYQLIEIDERKKTEKSLKNDVNKISKTISENLKNSE